MTLEERIKPYIEKFRDFMTSQKVHNGDIKQTPLERNPAHLDFEETIGGTTYIVKSFFDDNSNEDMLRKIIRLMNDSKVNEYKETD